MKRRSILIIAASIGSGHIKAAEAVSDELKIQYPDASIEIVDFTKWKISWATAFMKACYLFMLRFIPNLYDLMYRFTGGKSGGISVQSLISAITSADIASLVKKYQPDVILCTHPFPAGAASWRKKRHPNEFLFSTVITDYSVHQMWIYTNVDCYFVAREAMKTDLITAGLPAENVWVTGIPVKAGFHQAADKAEVLSALGLEAGIPTVLIMGGGLGLGGMEYTLKTLGKIETKLQLIVIAGRNEELKRRMEESSKDCRHSVCVLGFTQRVRDYMMAADLLISKPGALTITEALSAELPMVLHEPIPGPETENAVYIARLGAAVWVNKEGRLEEELKNIFASQEKLTEMRKREHLIKRPLAAKEIAEILSRELENFIN